MTEKYMPDEIPENLIPEETPETGIPLPEDAPVQDLPTEEAPAEVIPTEEPAAEEIPADEVPVDASSTEIPEEAEAAETADEAEDVPFSAAYAPDEFIPDDPEETAEKPAAETTETAEYIGSSGYMDNYPVLPDAVETPKEVPAKAAAFDDGGEFDQYFDQNQPEKKQESRERPTRKGRPKRPKGYGLLGIPHILATIVWLMIIVAIGVSMGRMIWVCAADVLAFGREEKIVTVSVTTADTMETIADKLYQAGLVNYPELFLFYADLTDADEKITTGSFTLNTVYDYHALVNQMSPRSGNRVVIEDVLIPEGYNCAQIFALLEQKGICKASDLEEWAANGALDDYWFLEGVERGHKYCLEGFLFPDTYDFYENSTPKLALEKMLDGFDYRYTEELNAKLPALNERLTAVMRKNGKSEEFIAENQFDLRKLITVASLIEEETASASESYKIASVIYNRLYNWGSNPPFLNIDAAIFYALGEHKSALTSEDLQIDSPYNTYRYQGLVPGPISNPGLSSIEAALDPEDTSYYYYVLNPDAGVHDFSKTLSEHEKKVAKYLGGG